MTIVFLIIMFQFDFTLDPNHIEALITNVWRSHCPASISIMRTSRSLSKKKKKCALQETLQQKATGGGGEGQYSKGFVT